ncbi:MAG: N-acetyl-gamma-glutamyl-phosphate reductase, partial [Myxococcota bacterium]
MSESMRAAVFGASGYGGAELVRLILGHPHLRLVSLHAHSRAGEPVARVLPSLQGLLNGALEPLDSARVDADVVFLGLPHGASAVHAKVLRKRGVRVVDLSADFRLQDPSVYAEWYGEHGAPDLFGGAVYGLVEYARGALKGAEFIAVPGCYPTAALLTLSPLVESKLIELDGIIVDAKSGVSGAGRRPSMVTHLPHAAEGVRAYKVAGTHRHTPEIEQLLSSLSGRDIRLSFTPHLVPMSRGILATAYATAKDGVTEAQLREAAERRYGESPLV